MKDEQLDMLKKEIKFLEDLNDVNNELIKMLTATNTLLINALKSANKQK